MPKAARVLLPRSSFSRPPCSPVRSTAAAKMPIGFSTTSRSAGRATGSRISTVRLPQAPRSSTPPRAGRDRADQAADAWNGAGPAYHLNTSTTRRRRDHPRVRAMIDIYGTPKWANGTRRRPPAEEHVDADDLARMLRDRYNGNNGHGSGSLYSVSERAEPRPVPDAAALGKKIVGPSNRQALPGRVLGIKSGNPLAKVGNGETLARAATSRSAARAPRSDRATFARLLSQQRA